MGDDALANIDTTELPDGASCFVNENKTNYRFDKTSSSNVGTLAPQSGPGRWFPIASATPNVLFEHNSGSIGPANPITFTTTGTIQKLKSGLVWVWARMCPIPSADGLLTFVLVRDPGVGEVILPVEVDLDTFQPQQRGASASWIDTLPDDLPHKYGIRCTTTAGTLTDPNPHDVVIAVEL